MEKISSGRRINRAGDDAAGLAISSVLKADIRVLDQATRNAADGVSLVQVAEGQLTEISGILIRMKELAVQSMTGTLSDTERGFLGSEYNALRGEINRIAWGAEFNGVSLLDGSGGTVGIEVGMGTEAYDQVDVDLTRDVDTVALSLSSGITNAGWAVTALIEVENAADEISEIRGNFGALQNRLESAIRNIQNSATSLAAANSRIEDVDIAHEVSRMTSSQILQQAGVSVLGQSNEAPQIALRLIGG